MRDHHDHDHAHPHAHAHPHDHDHEAWSHPGLFRERDRPLHARLRGARFTVGIGGPVGSGKTALVLALCQALRDTMRLGVVTNDIFTREDAEFLQRNEALPRPSASARSRRAAARTRPSARTSATTSTALEQLMETCRPELLLVESGGDNLAAQFSRELVDYTIYVIDVAGATRCRARAGPASRRATCSSSTRPTWRRPSARPRRDGRATRAGCAATGRPSSPR